MNISWLNLETLLRVCAAMQWGIATLNLFLPHIFHWKEDLRRQPLLLREVFQIHLWFISITLAIFGVMTWRFASEMVLGMNDALRWLAASIGLFWAIRTVLQVTYYSSSHWRGQVGRTAIHVLLLILYGGFAACYFWSALLREGGIR
jgi:hypothetical protein